MTRITAEQAAMHNRRFPVAGQTRKPLAEGDRDALAVEREGGLHNDIISACRMNRWAFAHNRMDRKSTAGNGVADFIIFASRGRTLIIECKTKTGKLSPEQLGFKLQCELNGHTVHVVRSMAEFHRICEL